MATIKLARAAISHAMPPKACRRAIIPPVIRSRPVRSRAGRTSLQFPKPQPALPAFYPETLPTL